MKKINLDYDNLSGCDDIDVSDIVGTLLDSLPADYNITGNVTNLFKSLHPTLNSRRNAVQISGRGGEWTKDREAGVGVWSTNWECYRNIAHL